MTRLEVDTLRSGTKKKEQGMITTADEFSGTYDRAAFRRLVTSKKLVSRCVQEMTEEQMAEIDALLDEADELEERAAHLRALADALREIYEYGAHPDD